MKTNSLPKFIQNALEINIIGPCSLECPISNTTLPTLFIDGGIDHPLDLEHSFSLGDGDSSTRELDHLLPSEKDMSDLAYALAQLSLTSRKLHIYGMLGGRKDHELINIGEVFRYSSASNSLALFHKDFTILPKGEHSLSIFGEFSVMTLEKCLITISGQAKHTLDKETQLLPFSSLGLSNFGEGEITLKSNSPLIIYTQEQFLILS